MTEATAKLESEESLKLEFDDDGRMSWTPVLRAISCLRIGEGRLVSASADLDQRTLLGRVRASIYSSPITKDSSYKVRSTAPGTVKVTRVESSPKKVLEASSPVHSLQLVSAPTIAEILIAKLPDFDPAWPDSTKDGWFAAYEEVVRLVLPSRSTVIK